MMRKELEAVEEKKTLPINEYRTLKNWSGGRKK